MSFSHRQHGESIEAKLENAILQLLDARGAGKTICPSEAARFVASSDDKADWGPLMEPARAAVRRLVSEGKIVVTQGRVIVNPSTAKGPIRLGKVSSNPIADSDSTRSTPANSSLHPRGRV